MAAIQSSRSENGTHNVVLESEMQPLSPLNSFLQNDTRFVKAQHFFIEESKELEFCKEEQTFSD